MYMYVCMYVCMYIYVYIYRNWQRLGHVGTGRGAPKKMGTDWMVFLAAVQVPHLAFHCTD